MFGLGLGLSLGQSALSGGAPVSPFAAFNATVQALYTSTAATGVWYDGTDPQYLTVNSDGTGGAPASGANFGRFIDRTGGGNHCVQATAASVPWYDATDGCVFFPNLIGPGRTAISFALSTAAPGGVSGTQACSGVMIVDTQSLPFDSLPSASVTVVAKVATKYPCAKSFIAWRFTPSKHEVYVNGTLYTGGAIASAALRQIRLGTTITGPGNIYQNETSAFYQYVLYNVALNDADFLTLRNAASTASGASTLNSNVVLFWGDSNTQSSGSLGKHWTRAVARARSDTCYNYGRAGAGYALQQTDLNSAISTVKGGAVNTVYTLFGVNDNGQILVASDVEVAARGNCNYARSESFRSIIATYPKTNGTAGTYCSTFNTAIRANWREYADGFSDLVTLTNLTDSSNTTYFSDTTHFNDSLTTTIAADVNAQLNLVRDGPYVNFTAAPRDGATSVASTYANTTTGAVSYAWDFTNNGSTDSAATNPSDTNSTLGNFSPKLTATNAAGSIARVRPFYINVLSAVTPVTAGRVGCYILNTGITQSGGFMSVWADQDATLGNIVQATGANQPAVGGSGQIITDGAARYAQTALGTLGVNWSAIIRFKVVTHTANRCIIDGLVNNGLNLSLAASTYVKYSTFGNGPTVPGITAGSWQTVYIGQSPFASSLRQQCVIFDGSEVLMNQQYTGQPAPNGVSIGAKWDGSSKSNVEYALLHVFTAKLTNAQIQQEFAYARTLI